MPDTDMDWPGLATAADLERARAIAVALEQQVAQVRDYAATLDASASRMNPPTDAHMRRIADTLRRLTGVPE